MKNLRPDIILFMQEQLNSFSMSCR